MPEKLTPLDHRIIEVSRAFFLEKGILQTEMKEIAAAVGISRSSLYRHFASSRDIAFYVMPDVLDYLLHLDEPMPGGLTGYEEFSFYMRKTVDKMCANLNMLRLIREFDTIYNLKESSTEIPQYYENYYRGSYEPARRFRKGLEDGSIRSAMDEVKAPLTFAFTAIALVEHIMLREENYLHEHGAAREFVDYAVELMLSGIRG